MVITKVYNGKLTKDRVSTYKNSNNSNNNSPSTSEYNSTNNSTNNSSSTSLPNSNNNSNNNSPSSLHHTTRTSIENAHYNNINDERILVDKLKEKADNSIINNDILSKETPQHSRKKSDRKSNDLSLKNISDGKSNDVSFRTRAVSDGMSYDSKILSDDLNSDLKWDYSFSDTLCTLSQNIENFLENPNIRIQRDKIYYTYGICNIIFNVYLFSGYPLYFIYYYILQSFILLPLRCCIYVWRRWQYYLIDFCYATNLLVILYLLLFNTSAYLFQISYILSFGPLMCATIPWKNSIVPHGLDKMTSNFIHIIPPLALYLIRWNTDLQTRFIIETDDSWLYQFIVFRFIGPLIYYILWQSLYSAIVYTRMDIIKKWSFDTSFHYLVKYYKGSLGDYLRKSSPSIQHYIFIMYQLVYTLVTMFIAILCYEIWIFNILFVNFIIIRSIYLGAGFYFDYLFVKGHASIVKKMEEKLQISNNQFKNK